MSLPNFFIVGAHKAGTTSLYEYLSQHPSVFMSSDKEPRYFTLKDNHSFNVKQNDPAANCKYRTIDDYKSLFIDSEKYVAVGEASTLYLYHEKAPENIYDLIPRAKIIAILRNPIKRAYSNYIYALRDGREDIMDFKSALDLEEDRIKKGWGPLWHYKRKGLYAKQLKRYKEFFSKEQMLILLYEDYQQQQKEILNNIFSFLDVANDFTPNTGIRYNVSGIPKNKWFHDFLKNPTSVRFIYKFIPRNLRKKIKQWVMQKNLNEGKENLPPLTDDAFMSLCDYYRDDVYELEELIGRKLHHWFEKG